MSCEIDKVKKLNLSIPKLSPLKINNVFLNTHSKHNNNNLSRILITEPKQDARKKLKHHTVNKKEENAINISEENKFKQLQSLVSDIEANGSFIVKGKLVELCKDIIKRLSRFEDTKISILSDNVFEEKISDLNMKFDYLSKENSKIKAYLHKKFDEMTNMYKEFAMFNSHVKKFDLSKLKLLNPKRKSINISHLLKSKVKDKPHHRLIRNTTDININNSNCINNNCDFSNLTFNEIDYNSNKANTETEV